MNRSATNMLAENDPRSVSSGPHQDGDVEIVVVESSRDIDRLLDREECTARTIGQSCVAVAAIGADVVGARGGE